jgi:hypothetical protein
MTQMLTPPAARPTTEPTFRTMEITRDEHIVAPIEIVWESILEMMGPASSIGSKDPIPMTLEAWAGGRWFRDYGNGRQHFWGHVQVIKPGTLLEICGPLFMSFAATSHISYRLTADGPTTKLAFKHTAMGLFDKDLPEGMTTGWGVEIGKIVDHAQRKASSR